MIKLLLLMILAHVIDDYFLQGILASMKQKSWWRKQDGYKDMYKDDYQVALLMHSMEWSIMVLLPGMFMFNLPELFLAAVFVVNTAIHYYVDDLKANKLAINLWVDQGIHIIQIILTWHIMLNVMGL